MKNLSKNTLTIAVLVMTVVVFSKNYYIKQILIADTQNNGKMDTTYQETYISDDLIVMIDEISRSFIDNESFAFYNMSDSSFFKKTFKELEGVMTSSDSQLKDFKINKTDEKTKIGPWKSEKYTATANVMGMDLNLDMYIAKDTGFPVDLMVRQQDKMYLNSNNIKNMTDKIKATGGIVVREIAKIGGTTVSEKQIITIMELDKIEKKYTDKPKGFKEMKQ
ncbi:MAG: hypothetical protein KKD38_00870 [Candidatus Delongbacteria bacterium]|nr:hypothetical protein [Candidatus Delongbacteria bacterium]MCG2759903.1 hypothetical protein [Candidatus Delongbacteria bacterium]